MQINNIWSSYQQTDRPDRCQKRTMTLSVFVVGKNQPYHHCFKQKEERLLLLLINDDFDTNGCLLTWFQCRRRFIFILLFTTYLTNYII